MPPKKSNHAKADVVGGRRVKKRKSDHEDNSATAQSPLVQELDGAVSDRAGNAVARRDNQGNDMVLTRGAALRTKVKSVPRFWLLFHFFQIKMNVSFFFTGATFYFCARIERQCEEVYNFQISSTSKSTYESASAT